MPKWFVARAGAALKNSHRDLRARYLTLDVCGCAWLPDAGAGGQQQ